jgi:hypothetical protein
VQAFASHHLIPTDKLHLFVLSWCDVVSLHPLGGAHKTTSFPMPVVYSICYLLSFSFLLTAKQTCSSAGYFFIFEAFLGQKASEGISKIMTRITQFLKFEIAG